MILNGNILNYTFQGEKVQTLTNQVSVLEYDLAKIKTERVELMEHYSERFKKLNDELVKPSNLFVYPNVRHLPLTFRC